jgi:redox-sensitive bicupin YhaK (pirin superfamily)
MTAGSGIVHQEMPKGDKQGRMYGFQLWANLPARQKMMDPRYRDVTAKDIPEVKLPGGVAVKVVAGEVAGTRFLLISGKPLGEPVAWYGPIVMNTQEELRLAFEEYERGTFLKHHR